VASLDLILNSGAAKCSLISNNDHGVYIEKRRAVVRENALPRYISRKGINVLGINCRCWFPVPWASILRGLGVRDPRFWDGGREMVMEESWGPRGLHEVLLYPIRHWNYYEMRTLSKVATYQ